MNKRKIILEYSVYNGYHKNSNSDYHKGNNDYNNHTNDYYYKNNLEGENSPYDNLCKTAILAADNAYSIYSGLSVGAAVLLENNEVILGSNQENISFPSGICAERTALFYAGSTYPNTPVLALALAAKEHGELLKKAISPCGSCRQVFAETIKRFKKDFDVIMIGQDESIIIKASALLPLAFNFDF